MSSPNQSLQSFIEHHISMVVLLTQSVVHSACDCVHSPFTYPSKITSAGRRWRSSVPYHDQGVSVSRLAEVIIIVVRNVRRTRFTFSIAVKCVPWFVSRLMNAFIPEIRSPSSPGNQRYCFRTPHKWHTTTLNNQIDMSRLSKPCSNIKSTC